MVAEVLDPGDARVLTIDGRRSHRYRSTYFDTGDDRSFRGAAHGRRRRFKVRVRHYVDSGETQLEVKARGARGVTVKERAPLDVPDDRLDSAALRHVAGQLAAAGVHGVDVTDLRPVLTTEYERVTVWLPESGARLTVDRGLVWSQPAAAGGLVRDAGGLIVVETKTPVGARSPVDRALWRGGCRPARFSKYGVGRALLDAGLPANRWHRAIDRDVAAASAFPVLTALEL